MALRNYRLRAGVRDGSGKVADAIHDVSFPAANDGDAIEAARDTRVNVYIGAGDYAWLTDDTGKVIWSLKVEES